MAQNPSVATDATPDAASPTATLHVYAAHVQMPVLVLKSFSLHPIPTLSRDRFSLRLDSGPPFLPSAVRQEGQDPITLAVLLDARGEQESFSPFLAPALVHLRTQELQPQDKLLLFAMDCATVRFIGLMPDDAEGVEQALKAVLGNPDLHGRGRARSCWEKVLLWDTMAAISNVLLKYPGPRVLLALTSGADHASRLTWSELRSMASDRSVSIFATYASGPESGPGRESILSLLCTGTGGVVLPSNRPRDLPQDMTTLIGLLRSRYILEFPRASRLGAGRHSIDVQVPHTPAAIYVTGMSVPILNPKLRDDPNTIRYLESDQPPVGTRTSLPSATHKQQ